VKLGAFATIHDEAGRVLLAHRRDDDFWMQPGGGVEVGEAPWEAIVREAREETGLHVAVERLAGVYCWPATGELIFSFICAVLDGQLSPSDETRDVRFFPPEALPANTFAEHRERIMDALAGRREALLRVPTCLSASEEVRRAREHEQARIQNQADYREGER
jgi:8-oxo-dGTP diphosphatase